MQHYSFLPSPKIVDKQFMFCFNSDCWKNQVLSLELDSYLVVIEKGKQIFDTNTNEVYQKFLEVQKSKSTYKLKMSKLQIY